MSTPALPTAQGSQSEGEEREEDGSGTASKVRMLVAAIARRPVCRSAWLRRLPYFHVDRREVLVIAVGIESLDAEQVEAGLLDPKGHTRSDPAARLEVHRESPIGHDSLLQV